MVLTFPLTEPQRWQLYSKLQGINLLLVGMFTWSGFYEHSPLRLLLATCYAGLWLSGVLAPGEKFSRFFGLNVLMLLVCFYIGPAMV